jgi:hypothetical protein
VNKASFRTLAPVLALMTASAIAHHSASMFEPVKLVTVTGVVKEFQYTNPHSWLIVEVTDAKGTVTTWGFEAEGPSTLLRSGIHRSDFAPGTKLTITGHPMKDGRTAATWEKAVRADGKEFNPTIGLAPK